MSRPDLETTILPVLLKHPEILFCYLFGSAAGQDRVNARDVDLAVYTDDEKLPSKSRPLWLADLHGDFCEALASNEVDLIHLNTTENLMLLDEIVRRGRPIYIQDIDRHSFFLSHTWHRTIDFKEKRKLLMGV